MDYTYPTYPSSTHSSPQSYAQELDMYYPPYPRPPNTKSATYGPLHVSTDTSHEHDPNERTARPGNAYNHALFHSQTMPLPSQSSALQLTNIPMDQDPTPPDPTRRDSSYTTNTPGLSGGLSRPLKPIEQDRLAQLDRLKFFLATAPSKWSPSSSANGSDQSNGSTPVLNGQSYSDAGIHQGGGPDAPSHPSLNRFLLPSGEYVSCVLWSGLYHITGTDIVRALVFRFEAFGRPVRNMKKFEEGVFSDLRNLKPGVDACLEEPKSPFLDLLFKYQCIRTQKKQKVFYWFSVPHDRLFLDALERDLKREKMGQEPTTVILGEPALSFTYDPKKSLYEQFSKASGVREGEGELESAVRIIERTRRASEEYRDRDGNAADESDTSPSGDEDDVMSGGDGESGAGAGTGTGSAALQAMGLGNSWISGSSTYKVRKKGPKRDDERERERRGRSILGDAHRRYGSLSLSRERAGGGDEYPGSGPGAGADALSAADMFRMQAHGEQVAMDGSGKARPSSAYYGEPHPQTQAQRFLHAPGTVPRGRSQEVLHRHTYPLAPPPATTASALSSNGFPGSFAQQQQQHQDVHSAGADGGAPGTKTKAFQCPLFSCGRMFKRMEHLKRHLRTHTMERPYACPQCNKKFSRSDNLNQHLRTHGRGHSGPVGGAMATLGLGLGLGLEGWGDASGDEAEGSTNGDSPDGRGASVGREGDSGSVDVDFDDAGAGLTMFGGGAHLDFHSGLLGGSAGFGYDSIDPQTCEVEIPGELHELSGDEDGLLTNMGHGHAFGQDVYYPGSAASQYPLSSGDFDPNWSLRPQPSPAFSASSPPLSALQLRNANRNSMSSSGYRTHSTNSSVSGSSVSGSSVYGDDYATSLSAPSHKQAFDHAGLYPPMLDSTSASSGAGPIRRHRSMTPSMIRNGEPIRRPPTAGSDYQGDSPGSSTGLGLGGGGRGYHPYAPYGSSSRSASTHSSPSVYPIPLAGEYPHAHPGLRRSESRNSNLGSGGMQEQIRQMMNMSMDGGGGGPGRTESPFVQTESPAAFTSELPPAGAGGAGGGGGEYTHAHAHAGAPGGAGVFGLGDHMQVQDPNQFVLPSMEDDSASYYHPHPQQHATI
ncbi:hypothetical protein H0H92_013852 [Tricholoma furcatifolium]|nr:hypothetical protein H0H92_013852 [Tricholoma furcatifolium]